MIPKLSPRPSVRTAAFVAAAGALTASIVALAAAPPVAAADLDVRVVGGVLVIDGTRGSDEIYVDVESPTLIRVTATSSLGTILPLVAGAGCAQHASVPQWVECSTTGVTRIRVNAGWGDDTVWNGHGFAASSVGFVLPFELYGDIGRDDLRGGPGNDLIDGGPGDDEQLLGGPGNDRILGGPGNDQRLAGDGNGATIENYGSDVIDGGPGIDTFNESRTDDRLHFWSLDGKPNDGIDLDDNRRNGAEEKDNILPTIENITGGISAEVIVGSAKRNVINGYAGKDVIYGRAGNDDLRAPFGGSRVYGEAGNDRIDAEGLGDGGPGRDRLEVRGVLIGGPGVDSLFGGSGNDTIRARDGEADEVSCGLGADVAYVDGADKLDQSLEFRCEQLR
jgi:Ca2+-binding RTX toxin-like protein